MGATIVHKRLWFGYTTCSSDEASLSMKGALKIHRQCIVCSRHVATFDEALNVTSGWGAIKLPVTHRSRREATSLYLLSAQQWWYMDSNGLGVTADLVYAWWVDGTMNPMRPSESGARRRLLGCVLKLPKVPRAPGCGLIISGCVNWAAGLAFLFIRANGSILSSAMNYTSPPSYGDIARS